LQQELSATFLVVLPVISGKISHLTAVVTLSRSDFSDWLLNHL